MKTLVISNQKGGVGKTTIAVHIALQAVSMGLRTLFIDLDVQANSSQFFLNYLAEDRVKIQQKVILPTASLFSDKFDSNIPEGVNFCLMKAESVLADLELNLSLWVKNLKSLDNAFDICVIDTPPTLGLTQIAPMVIADYVLSPIELSSYSVQGAVNLITTLNNIRDKYNANLKFLGLLPSRVNNNNNRQKSILADMQNKYEHFMYPEHVIPERQAFAESSYLNLPVWEIKEHSARKVSTKSRPVFADIINRVME